jgi:hypothetical protein
MVERGDGRRRFDYGGRNEKMAVPGLVLASTVFYGARRGWFGHRLVPWWAPTLAMNPKLQECLPIWFISILPAENNTTIPT